MTYLIQITDKSQIPEKTRFLGACIGKPRQFENKGEAIDIIRENTSAFDCNIVFEIVEMIEE